MSRLEVRKKSKAQLVVDNLYEDLERRIIASPPGLCPVDMTASFLKLFHQIAQEESVPVYQLIVEVSKTDRKAPGEELIRRTAQALKHTQTA